MKQQTKLNIRQANLEDIQGIVSLIVKAYPGFPPYPDEVIQSQIHHFSDGVFVAELGGKIVGYSASLLISESKALAVHS